MAKRGDPKRNAYREHRYNAAHRGIPFRFTFAQWVEWWGDDFDRRGRTLGRLVMARRRDQGAYEPSNCYKATHTQNANDYSHEHVAEAARRRHAARKAAGGKWHLEVRGDGHPKSKAVMTPIGRFGSAALAAEHYGISRAGMAWRCKNLLDYWYEDAPPQTAKGTEPMNSECVK